MKTYRIQIIVGSPIFEDGVDETILTVHKDELQMIDFYIECLLSDGEREYIVLVDSVPTRWAMTDRKGVTHEYY